MTRWFIVVLLALGASACAGLQQFPETTTGVSVRDSLSLNDKDYLTTLTEIEKESDENAKKRMRNSEIERRLRIIDINFERFITSLSQENVTAQFGTSIVQLGVGGAGALVEQTASQILSAISAGAAGAQSAYGKAALFDQALPALLAQMIASRKAILTRILKGMSRSIDEYPLAAAVIDLDAYYFAGSLPGAVVATSADATVKNDEADAQIEFVRDEAFTEAARQDRVDNFLDLIDALPDDRAIELSNNPPVSSATVDSVVAGVDPNNARLTDGNVARRILKMRAVLADRDDAALDAWEAALTAEQ